MAARHRSLVSFLATSMLLAGMFFAGSAAPPARVDEPAPAYGWAPKSTDWPTFHHGADRTGLSPATANMKLAYYKWAAKTGGVVYSSPAVATVNTTAGSVNRAPKVFIGSEDGRLYCLDGPTGSVLGRFQAQGAIRSCPSVGDLAGDGMPEVVFGSNDGRIYCLDAQNGTKQWHFPTRGYVTGSPALADLNGDGRLEVAAGSQDGRVYVLNAEGKVLWAALMDAYGDGIAASPAVGDVNGDGRPELVVETAGSNITCFDGASGRELWSFTGMYYPWNLQRTPVIADLDGDGRAEVLAIGNQSDVHCLDGSNGTVRWRRSFSITFGSSPAVGDAGGDGVLDVFITFYDGVLCLNGANGSTEWSRGFVNPGYATGAPADSSPALADIDGDGGLEVMFGASDRMVHALNAEDGTPRWAWPCPMMVRSSPAVADIDGDGKAEVVFGCNDQRVYALDYNF